MEACPASVSPAADEDRKTASIGCVFPLGLALPMISWETAVVLADRLAVKRSGRNGTSDSTGREFQRTILGAPAGGQDIADLVAKKILGVLSSRTIPRSHGVERRGPFEHDSVRASDLKLPRKR